MLLPKKSRHQRDPCVLIPLLVDEEKIRACSKNNDDANDAADNPECLGDHNRLLRQRVVLRHMTHRFRPVLHLYLKPRALDNRETTNLGVLRRVINSVSTSCEHGADLLALAHGVG